MAQTFDIYGQPIPPSPCRVKITVCKDNDGQQIYLVENERPGHDPDFKLALVPGDAQDFKQALDSAITLVADRRLAATG